MIGAVLATFGWLVVAAFAFLGEDLTSLIERRGPRRMAGTWIAWSFTAEGVRLDRGLWRRVVGTLTGAAEQGRIWFTGDAVVWAARGSTGGPDVLVPFDRVIDVQVTLVGSGSGLTVRTGSEEHRWLVVDDRDSSFARALSAAIRDHPGSPDDPSIRPV